MTMTADMARTALRWLERQPVEAVERDGVLACGHCGAGVDDWQHEEDVLVVRRGLEVDEDGDHIVWVDGAYDDYGDGNDTPGLVCSSCWRAIELPDGWDMDWV